MQEYHYVWLEAHPDRTIEWLKEMLRAGFEVHHVDWNRDNNSPDNLVLIEASDHQKLHALNQKPSRKAFTLEVMDRIEMAKHNRLAAIGVKLPEDAAMRAYTMFVSTDKTWKAIADEIGYKSAAVAHDMAEDYALSIGGNLMR